MAPQAQPYGSLERWITTTRQSAPSFPQLGRGVIAVPDLPTCVIFDELWVQKKRDLFEALAGGLFKRDRALLICTSTAGYDPSSLLAER